MAVRVLMPALSPTMTEGNVAKWLKKEGDKVKSGDILAEIETDKATMEVEAVDEGVLGKIVAPDGAQGVKVNAVIAVILEEGEDKSVLAKMELGAPAAAAPGAAPAAAPAPAAPAPAPAAPVMAPAAAAAAPVAAQGRVFASPLARRMAEQAGVNLAAIRGSGPHGRVVKLDIEAAIAGGAVAAAAPAAAVGAAIIPMVAPAAAPPPSAPGVAYEDVPANNIRKVVAQRLLEAKQQVPHFYLTIDCEIDQLLKLRAALNARSDKYKLSVNDFVIRASALALRKLPKVNASWLGTAMRFYKTVDISVAVAIDDGLITPIIRNADHKGLIELSEEMKALAMRAREKPMKLQPHEYQGGSFSISNLGMFGIKHFEAIINPPQACILAVGAGESRAIVKDGALAIATVMSCTLSVDHRVVDGALGAEFLKVFKGLIEDPMTMLL